MALIDIIGSLTFCFGMSMLVSPAPGLYKGLKDMKIQNITFSYFFLGFVQCLVWLAYGIKEHDAYIWLINLIATLLYTIYLNLFLYITREKLMFLYSNVSMVLCTLVSFYVFNSTICLWIAAIITCFWQTTTIPVTRKALATKDASFVNILIACLSFGNFFLWFTYGLLKSNAVMAGKYFVALSFCAINIEIYCWAKGYVSDNNPSILFLKLVYRSSSLLNDEKEKKLIDLSTDIRGNDFKP
jgi:uncharacterized protein with PQ loop repeat